MTNTKIKPEDLKGLSNDVKELAIKAALETPLKNNVRKELEQIFFETFLKEGLDSAYVIERYGSTEAKRKLVQLYLDKGEIVDAAELVENNSSLQDLREKIYPRLEELALEKATTLSTPRFGYFAEFNNLKWGINQIKKARQCSEKEARIVLAKKFEELGNLGQAKLQYYQIEDYDNVARLCLDLGDKENAAEAYESGKRFDLEAEIWTGLGKYSQACEALLKKGDIAEVRRIAAENGLDSILAGTWKGENKWVAKAIDERKANEKAKTLKDKVRAHSSSDYAGGGINFLTLCLSKGKLLSDETKNAVQEVLQERYEERAEEYEERVHDLESSCNPGDGGGAILPDREDLEKAKKLRAKMTSIWERFNRYDKLAKYEDDPEKKAELYLKAGMKTKAAEALDYASRIYASGLELEKAKELSTRARKLR